MSHTWWFDHSLPSSDDEEMSNEENPRVFLDISINGCPAAERIEIELFANVVPKTAENFRALCTGERGYGSITGRRLHYKGTVFHRICKGFLAQGGDISEEQNGEGGESIYGGYFPDENFQLSHSVPGMLSMVGGGRDRNGSQFFITFTPHPFLDRCHVVFGKVREGMGTLYKIDQMGTPGGEPTGLVQITDCGELKNNVMESDKGEKKKTLKRASSSYGRVEELGDERKYSSSRPSGLVQITACGEISEDKKNIEISKDKKNIEISKDKKNNVMESDKGKKKKTFKRAGSSDGGVEELSDERKYSSSRPFGPVQIIACGEISEDEKNNEISEDKKNNVMESDKGKKKKTLKRAGSSDGGVEDLSDERKKRRKKRRKNPNKLK
ncbi:hypothetical protein L1987_45576 [Smallanthus sonchifolius]|uniref:Uncharacterized protein n=1 Tax=Smallanthus sonchifolius TaxID=185202 RepID=A0ACB9FXD3_9ASTR|nr:hypothetical protein L1987_45576 [Smallanthus sonchifolius]